MAIDTLVAYVGVYDSVEDAEADYQLVKDLHTKADLIDGYDAAVVERRDGKTNVRWRPPRALWRWRCWCCSGSACSRPRSCCRWRWRDAAGHDRRDGRAV
jgi:hypothetical protein